MDKVSKFLGLNLADLAKSAIMAFMGSFLTGFYKFIEMGSFPESWAQWKPIVLGGIISMVGYLIKNALTNNEGEFLKKDK
jgi:hypothetical protein